MSQTTWRESLSIAGAHPVEGLEASRAAREQIAPAVRALDEIHEAAVSRGASDVHVEPTADGGRVRLRIDGMLYEARRLDAALFAQVIARIKLLASMDIAERRLPQDGAYGVRWQDRTIDARASSIPTVAGEKLVLRLLDMDAEIPTLEALGMDAAFSVRYRDLVHRSSGFVVVCGPTGSGKTTTLYASLAERNETAQQICTVEDPVEIRMAGLAQVQVNERAGLTFTAALRSFLRADPNVVMIGEMRDAETAKVALSAALSGQLIMTTLHAADAPRAVERLSELGLSRRALAAGLSGIVAQRLLRRLCSACTLSEGAVRSPQRDCVCCGGSGYRGRVAVFELLEVTSRLGNAIACGSSFAEIVHIATEEGYRPMRESARALVGEGVTTANEVRRALFSGDDA